MVPSRPIANQPDRVFSVTLLTLAILASTPARADRRCISCHAKEVAGYGQSGMARSLAATYWPAGDQGGKFTHAASGSRLTIVRNPEGMTMRIERAGLRAERPASYVIGSGAQGHSYVVRIGDYLFQAPASYYASRRAFGVSPGYQQDHTLDFDRPVTPECLFCHAGQTRPVRGTINRYQDPPFFAESISCERCHGPAEAHLARPVANNIVNPARLPSRARDSVCEQCHLSGEARVLHPGRSFGDFVPGRDLEEVFSVYVYGGAADSRDFKVVSQAEQLVLSQCAQASKGRMWCGSCHNPHERPVDVQQYYRERCLSCHGKTLLARHQAPVENCAGCHMPRRASSDIAHTSFSDHRILRRPRNPGRTPPTELSAWREPAAALARRNLGLAYVSVGERDQAALLLNEGFRLLASVGFESSGDADVLAALGLVLLRKDRASDAVRMFEQAARVDPSARNLLNLGVAQDRAGQNAAAIGSLERAIELDPSLAGAYVVLADLHGRMEQPQRRREVLERYLRFNPQSLSTRQALQASRKMR
jgi:tetratricopeptide (TPR) repeat protein